MATWSLVYANYASGSRKFFGYLYGDFYLRWQLDQAANLWHGRPQGPTFHILSYPGNDVLQGFGMPRCLGEAGSPYTWTRVVETGGSQTSGWFYANCYDLEELVRWLKGSDMPGRRYDFSGGAVA